MKLSEHLERIERVDQLDITLVKTAGILAAVAAILLAKEEIETVRLTGHDHLIPELKGKIEEMMAVIREQETKAEAEAERTVYETLLRAWDMADLEPLSKKKYAAELILPALVALDVKKALADALADIKQAPLKAEILMQMYTGTLQAIERREKEILEAQQ